MEPFKNIYNRESITQMTKEISKVFPKFNSKDFKKNIFKTLQTLEMKQRVELISEALHTYLPKDYTKATSIMLKTMFKEANPQGLKGFMLWPYSHYVEVYGLEDLDRSSLMMLEITKNFTSEFCIRAFLQQYPKQMYKLLNSWTKDNSEHVRRLVSEGTRPNLPWAKKVDHIENNLDKNINLLEKLKYDKSQYVQKSIANHLNDISRLDKELMLKVCEKWSRDKKVPITTIRHASRTLLKAGDKNALKLHGYNPNINLSLESFSISAKSVKLGKSFNLSLKLNCNSSSKKPQKILVEYIIHFLKNNGSHSPKIFRLKDLTRIKDTKIIIEKEIKFRDVTTRKHYAGKHFIEIQINGKSYGMQEFKLII